MKPIKKGLIIPPYWFMGEYLRYIQRWLACFKSFGFHADIDLSIRLWGADEVLTFPDDGKSQPFSAYFPPVGGFRFGLFTVPPESEIKQDEINIDKALAEMEEKLPGMLSHMEPENPGMHTTDTVDFEYVISGEIWLELDDGKEVHLKVGDTIVQNGTRHAWRNRGNEPCQMVVCLVGAKRVNK